MNKGTVINFLGRTESARFIDCEEEHDMHISDIFITDLKNKTFNKLIFKISFFQFQHKNQHWKS